MIKHLVLCGGGHSIFKSIGALQTLEKNNFWNISNIKSIYGTSAGAILGAMLCLKFDNAIIENYLVNRPWHDAFPIKAGQIMDAYSKKGLYDHHVADIIFKPLLNAKDLPLTITMQGLYDYSNIELHMYSLEMNEFKVVDISYKTHPELPLMTGLIMSSAVPGIFVPYCEHDKCYVDGGVVVNYPLNNCLKNGCDKNEILGVRFSYVNDLDDVKVATNVDEKDLNLEEVDTKGRNGPPTQTYLINKESNILDFFMGFFGKLIQAIGTEHVQERIPNELICRTTFMTLKALKTAMTSLDNRRRLFDDGSKEAEAYFLAHKDSANMVTVNSTNSTNATIAETNAMTDCHPEIELKHGI